MRMIFKSLMMLTGGLMVAASVSAAQDSYIKGKLHNYPGTGYFLLINEDDAQKYDTLKVAADGSFSAKVSVSEPKVYGLYLEYLGDNRSVISCYVKPGTTLNVEIDGGMKEEEFLGQKQTRYVSEGKFSGPGKKESEFLNIPPFYNFKYFGEDGKPVTFANFKQQIADVQKSLSDRLEGTSPEFKAAKQPEIDEISTRFYVVYPRFLKSKGFNAGDDKEYMEFINSVDLNCPNNVDNELTAGVVEFLLGSQPDLYSSEPDRARTFCFFRDKITNPEVREKLADNRMDYELAVGDNENLVRTFEVYTQCSGKSEAYKANKTVYDSLSKLLPGVKATDFEMQDVKGNKVRFLDVVGQGKVVYIDFWATWCGPCCAEIPFVEKLVEKYKDNKKIEFVSISLDNNKKKWLDKLAKDKPQWRQFIIPDNFNSTFAKEYNIRAIPRFMVFDGQGRIININAERPSADNIETVLNGYIR